MRRFLIFTGIVIFHSMLVCGQTPESQTCPVIHLAGPSVFVKPGEVATYTVTVDAKGLLLKPEYKWSISSGTILAGQGTTVLEVKQSDTGITVTVDVDGFPAGCPNAASEAAPCGLRPTTAEKIDELAVPISKVSELRSRKITDAIGNNPSSQLFIILRIPAGASARSVRRLRGELSKFLFGSTRDMDMRVTWVDSVGPVTLAEIWLVPPGANSPDVSLRHL